MGKNLDYLHLMDILKYEYELYLKQPLTSSKCKIVIAYLTSNHRLAIESWIVVDHPYLYRQHVTLLFAPLMKLKSNAHFVLECPRV